MKVKFRERGKGEGKGEKGMRRGKKGERGGEEGERGGEEGGRGGEKGGGEEGRKERRTLSTPTTNISGYAEFA